MSIHRPLAIAALLTIFSMPTVHAEGDAVAGRELAQEQCTRCHNIEPGGPFKLYPPSFASISVYRSAEQVYARIAYPPLHVNMPGIEYLLTPDSVDDFVAYIMSLENQ